MRISHFDPAADIGSRRPNAKGIWNNLVATTLMQSKRRAALHQSHLDKDEGPMPERHGDQIAETTTEARQGVTGHNVRYVLVWSTVGVIVSFVIVYFLFFR
jgi:hypothetical protein